MRTVCLVDIRRAFFGPVFIGCSDIDIDDAVRCPTLALVPGGCILITSNYLNVLADEWYRLLRTPRSMPVKSVKSIRTGWSLLIMMSAAQVLEAHGVSFDKTQLPASHEHHHTHEHGHEHHVTQEHGSDTGVVQDENRNQHDNRVLGGFKACADIFRIPYTLMDIIQDIEQPEYIQWGERSCCGSS